MRTRERPTPASVGRDKNRSFPASDSLNPALYSPENQAVCATCAFFKAVRLSARIRTFCMLSGQKLLPSTVACPFWPGIEFAEAVL